MSNEELSELQLVEDIKAKKERLNELASLLAEMNIAYHKVA